MSFSRVLSAAMCGMEVIPVQVEADVSNGLRGGHMVCYLGAEVREAEERVRTAIQNACAALPPKRMVINLSPGNVRKRGTSYDLPIALAVLAAAGLLQQECLEQVMVVGELGLDGSVQGIPGVLAIAAKAKEQQVRCLVVPSANEREARLVEGVCVCGIKSLGEIYRQLLQGETIGCIKKTDTLFEREVVAGQGDFADISGQSGMKRAAEIAVAGRHNLLMVGPPGSGKSMIAKRIPTIFPALTREESLRITKVYSVAGMIKSEQPLVMERPFREVNQTVTKAALLGGGAWPKPGELTLASGGVLFLDELAEFNRSVLEVLRQPLEEREVRIVRNHGVIIYPADVMLVAAMNPCPCGYFSDLNKCTCTISQIRQYQGKISYPFLGRMDICAEVQGVAYEDLEREELAESSADIRRRIEKARKRQMDRAENGEFVYNAELSGERLLRDCELGRTEKRMMRQAYDRFSLNARTYHKVLKVARTIADLEGEERIGIEHLQEALVYRSMDKKYWGRV